MNTKNPIQDRDDDNLNDLVEELRDVIEEESDSSNETSISDNNGGRIELNEDETGDGYIRK